MHQQIEVGRLKTAFFMRIEVWFDIFQLFGVDHDAGTHESDILCRVAPHKSLFEMPPLLRGEVV
ncbi:hypothetical protein D3C86_1903900 [compost metagenome]